MSECGRPTRRKTPCGNRLEHGERACRLHATEEDKVYREAWITAYKAGYSEGWQAGEKSGRWHQQEEDRKAQEAARKADLPAIPGHVVVDGQYAYAAHGLHLSVGDKVLLPDSGRGTWVGTVTSLHATYDGPVERIIGKVSE